MTKTYTPTKNIEFEQINKDFFQKGWTVLSEGKQKLLSKWIVQNNIHVLIEFKNGHWVYSPNKIISEPKDDELMPEDKVEVAKKILTIANIYDGEVYGGFVRDVIVPRMNDPNCDASFKDVDIWFKSEKQSLLFIQTLAYNFKIKNGSFLDKDLDYSKDSKFSRRQYHIYSENQHKFLFHIDVITSEKLPVNDFNVNTITYKYTNNDFEKCSGYSYDTRFITNKITVIFEDYNPEGIKYYERINRIFFSKGWTVRCYGKHTLLSNFIKKEKLNIKEICEDGFYNYIPYDKSKDNDESKSNDLLTTIFSVASRVRDDYLKNDKSDVLKSEFDPEIKKRMRIFPFSSNWSDEVKEKEITEFNEMKEKIVVLKKLQEDDKLKSEELKDDIELGWTIENAEKHAKVKSFIRVGGRKISNRFLVGATRSWSNSNPEENMSVFIIPLRITGTPEYIKKALKLTQPPYSEEKINNYLNEAINKDNYQTTKDEEYKNEIDDFMEVVGSRLKLDDVSYIMEMISNTSFEKLKDNTSKDDTSKDNTSKDDTSKDDNFKDNTSKDDNFKLKNINTKESKDDKPKDIMMSIFNMGLEKLESYNNNIEDEVSRYIYKIGLDEYRNKFDHFLKEM
jgi:hypothetical protein